MFTDCCQIPIIPGCCWSCSHNLHTSEPGESEEEHAQSPQPGLSETELSNISNVLVADFLDITCLPMIDPLTGPGPPLNEKEVLKEHRWMLVKLVKLVNPSVFLSVSVRAALCQ